VSNKRSRDWQRVRRDFRLDRSWIHLSAFWLSSHPRPVHNAISFFRRELDRNPVSYLCENEESLDSSSRAAIARLISGEIESIALTGSTTESLFIAFSGVKLSKEDEILISTHDHYSMVKSAELLASRTGAFITKAQLYDHAQQMCQDLLVSKLLAAITERTRVIGLTWVHSSSGVALPLQEMLRHIELINQGRAPERRICVIVDATHAVGVLEIKMHNLPCDYFASSCHKWLYGPRGTGFLWIKKSNFTRHLSSIPSFNAYAIGEFTGRKKSCMDAMAFSPGGFHCFEHRWAISAAINYYDSIGANVIRKRLIELSSNLKEELARCSGIRVLTPLSPELSAGIICFEAAGKSPDAIVEFLRSNRITASVSPYPKAYARLTPSIYNTVDDIATAAAALRSLVEH
jgi:isopenicillin-N epimerase